jgi:hypothetical protein
MSFRGKDNRRLHKRAATRAVVILTTVRLHGKLRLDSVSAILPTGKMARRGGDRILKESTVGTFLKGRSFGTFLSPRKEKYTEKPTDKLKFERTHNYAKRNIYFHYLSPPHTQRVLA